MSDKEPFVRQIMAGPMGNCLYIVGDNTTKKAMVVDPAWDAMGLIREASSDGFEVVGVLLTHTHQDHIGGDIFGQHIPGLREMREHLELPTFVHETEASRLMEVAGTPEAMVRRLTDGDVVEIGELETRVLHTPGHSPGSVCFHAGSHLIAGDTLFVQACGRVDLPGSDVDAMFHSLKRLGELAPETVVYPGHNYGPTPTSTIGNELVQNMFMRVPSLDKWQFLMGNL